MHSQRLFLLKVLNYLDVSRPLFELHLRSFSKNEKVSNFFNNVHILTMKCCPCDLPDGGAHHDDKKRLHDGGEDHYTARGWDGMRREGGELGFYR